MGLALSRLRRNVHALPRAECLPATRAGWLGADPPQAPLASRDPPVFGSPRPDFHERTHKSVPEPNATYLRFHGIISGITDAWMRFSHVSGGRPSRPGAPRRPAAVVTPAATGLAPRPPGGGLPRRLSISRKENSVCEAFFTGYSNSTSKPGGARRKWREGRTRGAVTASRAPAHAGPARRPATTSTAIAPYPRKSRPALPPPSRRLAGAPRWPGSGSQMTRHRGNTRGIGVLE